MAHNLCMAGALYVCGSGEEGRLGLGHLAPFQVDVLGQVDMVGTTWWVVAHNLDVIGMWFTTCTYVCRGS